MSADDVIARLGLKPHPEGGWYGETWPESQTDDHPPGRPPCTVIHYLLQRGERSHWHQVDATETWCFSAGDPLLLSVALSGDSSPVDHVLGADVVAGHASHRVVPAHASQAARPLGEWSLVSCVVAPGFEFDGFTLAPDDWTPQG